MQHSLLQFRNKFTFYFVVRNHQQATSSTQRVEFRKYMIQSSKPTHLSTFVLFVYVFVMTQTQFKLAKRQIHLTDYDNNFLQLLNDDAFYH